MSSLLLTLLLLSRSLLTLEGDAEWSSLSFDDVAANETSFEKGTIELRVKSSASPLYHLFPESRSIQSIVVSGRVDGTLDMPESSTWNDAPDDALLRIGVIEKGEKKLTPLQRLTAPEWIKQLEDRIGKNAEGVRMIHCFHLMPQTKWTGESRINPKVPLFHETIVAIPDAEGNFVLEGKLDHSVEACGIWILADGDDTESSFTVTLKEISILTDSDEK